MIDDGDFAVTVPVPAGFDTDNFPFAVWRKPFWGLTGNSAPLTNPNDVIFLTAVMENDDGKANTPRLAAQQATIASLLATTALSREDRVKKLIKDMQAALGLPTGGPNFDDRIGAPQELRLTDEQIKAAQKKPQALPALEFKQGDADYLLIFELTAN